MPTRRRMRPHPDRVDGRPFGIHSQPGADHAYVPAPGLAGVLASQGVTLEALSELTGYPVDYLRRMRDEGQTAPRVVTSRISAVLGVETDDIRGGW